MREKARERDRRWILEKERNIDKKRTTMLSAIATLCCSLCVALFHFRVYLWHKLFLSYFPCFSQLVASLSLSFSLSFTFLLSLFFLLYLLHLLSAIYIQMQNSIFRITNLATHIVLYPPINWQQKKGQNEQIMLKHSIVR